MTEAETAGESVLTQPGAVEPSGENLSPGSGIGPTAEEVREELGAQSQPGTPETEADPARPDADPLNAAIAATAGEPIAVHPMETVPSEAEYAAAKEAYTQAGISKAMAATGGSEIVTVGHLRAAIEALLRHLHFDHPENYLPK